MTVRWKQAALDAREQLLGMALQRAIDAEDPAIYKAACVADEQIQLQGDALDGVAIYKPGPISGTRLYICQGGKYLLIYSREGDEVQILHVAPAQSNWEGAGSP